MTYSIEFGGDPQDLTITLSGAIDPRSIRAFVEDLIAHPEYRAGLLILADITDVNTSSISVEEYETLTDLFATRDHRFPARATAIVAPAGRTYDDAMQHRAYVGGSKSGREVFQSRADATAWLATQR